VHLAQRGQEAEQRADHQQQHRRSCPQAAGEQVAGQHGHPEDDHEFQRQHVLLLPPARGP